MTTAPRSVTDPWFEALIAPRAIAVLGASDDPVKIGGRPLAFLLRHGYRGGLFPVNPTRATVQGLPAFPSLDALPSAVDLAIVVVPAERVLETLGAAAAGGVRVAIVFSSGFAEGGEAGRREQARIGELARRTGLRVLGPNCQGFAHLPSRLLATFASSFLDETLHVGPVAMVSQSGAMAGMLYEMARDTSLGFNYWVSTGNEADLQAAEILAEVVEDPETRVALCYLEDVKDAARFREALGRAHRRNVPVFVLKTGRTAEGRRAARSHTGALAGEDAVYDAVFREWGAIRAADPADLLHLPQAFLRYRQAGPRVAILSNSGGLGVLSVDLCADLGLVPAVFTVETTAGLRAALPIFAAPQNPVDLTAQLLSDPGMLMRVLPLLEGDPGVDMIVFQVALFGAASDVARFVGDVAAVAQRTSKVVAVSCPQRHIVERFRQASVLAFDDSTVALRSLACLAHATRQRSRCLARTTAIVGPPPPAPPIPRARASAHGFLSEWESRRLLEPFGLPLVQSALCADPDEAARVAERLGYPVVVKICSRDLPHKSEAGGVALGLTDARAVAEACRRIRACVAERAPGAAVEGFLVQRHAAGSLELALGVKTDPVFGPVVLVAAGGILVEALRDFRLLLPPIDRAAAEEALRGLRVGPLWDGARGSAPLDLPAAADLLVRLGVATQALGGAVAEIDLNPVLVGPRDAGATVLDALVRLTVAPR
ncbi:MAG: acetate--CoA ligase family protein [Candidatus Rokubacteria bacterium]|nr:acetate--CoA ligase family protein [Candidatus Rokubacteria bacterium]